ncbi:MAG: hypothetical protein Q7T62_01855 [Undibacterium sp.]|nr:hypothetical protein [Undibacterium sp.]
MRLSSTIGWKGAWVLRGGRMPFCKFGSIVSFNNKKTAQHVAERLFTSLV